MSRPASVCCVCQSVRERLMVCGRCRDREYCSALCQRRDWKGGHRQACNVPGPARSECIDAANVFAVDGALMDMMAAICYCSMTDESDEYKRVPVLTMVNRPWERVGRATLCERPRPQQQDVESVVYVCVHRVRKEAVGRLISSYLRDAKRSPARECAMLPCMLLRVVEATPAGEVMLMRVVDTVQYHLWLTRSPYLTSGTASATMVRTSLESGGVALSGMDTDTDTDTEELSRQLDRSREMVCRILHGKEAADDLIEGRSVLQLEYEEGGEMAVSLAGLARVGLGGASSALYRLAEPELARGDVLRLMRRR
jgi:hypothetical protein